MAKKAKKAKAKEVKKIHQSKKTKRYYGMTQLKDGVKLAWVSAQNKYGWSLGLALNERTVWLRNIRFANKGEVERALGKAKVVFIALKKTK